MGALVDWVEHDTAPAAVTFPVSGQSTGAPITSLTVQPFDPLSPPPHNNGLNSNYDYIGINSEYRPGHALWCGQDGRVLVCTGATGGPANNTRRRRTGNNRHPTRHR